jgi:hypothetical protein
LIADETVAKAPAIGIAGAFASKGEKEKISG